MKLHIREAAREDIPLLLSLIRELAEYEKLVSEVVVTEEILEESLFSQIPAAEALIGEYDGESIGFAIFFHNFSTFLGQRGLYLEDLYIKPEFRNRGFGREMLMHLAQIAVERNCGRFEWAVLDWNASAIGFYEKLGAQAMKDWTVFRVTGAALQELAQE